jgi:hypothetical protein
LAKVTVLFGAGASKDAGLPDAYELTKQVYDRLVEAKSNDAVLYAVVVAKLIARNAKNGQSPFSNINIEDVYDGLKRLLNRDGDILSEFVSGWDPISASSSKPFDAPDFARNLSSIFSFSERRSLDRSAQMNVNQRSLEQTVSELQRCFGGDLYQYRGASLEPFLTTLASILSVQTAQTKYMEHFLAKHCDNIKCIATLNYDQLVEVSLDKIDRKVDLGLTYWNEKRFVRFHGKSPKLIKLHGSTNWFIRNDDEIVFNGDLTPSVYAPSRAIIFGGQSEKLVPYGPFLHLRHQFHQFLQDSSCLLVIGYSFRDLHLNALIRSWIATRQNGKIIIVDPGDFAGDRSVFRYARKLDYDSNTKMRVKIKEIKKGFADALEDIDQELMPRPKLAKS